MAKPTHIETMDLSNDDVRGILSSTGHCSSYLDSRGGPLHKNVHTYISSGRSPLLT